MPYEEEVHGGADRFCAEAGRDGDTGGRDAPEDGDHGADLLPLEWRTPDAVSVIIS